jgi:hypothetical protein
MLNESLKALRTDHQIVQAIATEVAKHLSDYAWVALALQVVLLVGAAAAAALLGAYLKKTGEHLATKDRFDEILRQLEKRTDVVETIKADVAKRQLQGNTEIVETVRSELAQRDWAAREWANIRRVKIEELLSKVNDCREYLARHIEAADQGEELPKGDPVNELETIARLYFPQLKNETEAFLDMHRRLVFEGEKLRIFLARGGEQAKKQT